MLFDSIKAFESEFNSAYSNIFDGMFTAVRNNSETIPSFIGRNNSNPQLLQRYNMLIATDVLNVVVEDLTHSGTDNKTLYLVLGSSAIRWGNISKSEGSPTIDKQEDLYNGYLCYIEGKEKILTKADFRGISYLVNYSPEEYKTVYIFGDDDMSDINIPSGTVSKTFSELIPKGSEEEFILSNEDFANEYNSYENTFSGGFFKIIIANGGGYDLFGDVGGNIDCTFVAFSDISGDVDENEGLNQKFEDYNTGYTNTYNDYLHALGSYNSADTFNTYCNSYVSSITTYIKPINNAYNNIKTLSNYINAYINDINTSFDDVKKSNACAYTNKNNLSIPTSYSVVVCEITDKLNNYCITLDGNLDNGHEVNVIIINSYSYDPGITINFGEQYMHHTDDNIHIAYNGIGEAVFSKINDNTIYYNCIGADGPAFSKK